MITKAIAALWNRLRGRRRPNAYFSLYTLSPSPAVQEKTYATFAACKGDPSAPTVVFLPGMPAVTLSGGGGRVPQDVVVWHTKDQNGNVAETPYRTENGVPVKVRR
jgi:hypothetical protein